MPEEITLQITNYWWVSYFPEISNSAIKRKLIGFKTNIKNSWDRRNTDNKFAFCIFILDRFNLIKVAKVVWNILCYAWLYLDK